MATIKSLLNPLVDATEQDDSMDSKGESSAIDSDAPNASDAMDNVRSKPIRKKQKVSKDSAVFKLGAIRGECRYPPYEEQDEFLAVQHRMFEVYPVGHITAYPRHIPYNSEKKLFLDKTGREHFEVFQYRFKKGDTEYTMIWDYNIGLVRTTPLFKCGQYSKTTPAKMLARNDGLKEICHSITGGALVAQGYWIPYEAAKAIAATFCWDIRYALTPVFGKDFPAQCLHPDSDGFGNMQIDPEITKQCATQAQLFKDLELQEVSNSSSFMSSPAMPSTPKYKRQFKKIMPKPLRLMESTDDTSSVSSADDTYALSSPSPEIGYQNPWSAVNSPRSPSPKIKFRNPWSPKSTRSESPHGARSKHRAADIPRSYAQLDTMPPPYKPLYEGFNGSHTSLQASAEFESPCHLPREPSESEAQRRMDLDEDYDTTSEVSDTGNDESVTERKKSSKGFTATQAAAVLAQMKYSGSMVAAGFKRLKRPASL